MIFTHKLKLPIIALLIFTLGCDASESETSNPTNNTFSINFIANLKTDDDGMLSFMTPGATRVQVERSSAVGKPYHIAVFRAGFVPGLDEPLHYQWGTLDESLTVDWTTPADLVDGPYDVVFILYRETEITEEIVDAPIAIAAIDGDLATFTISTDDILDGDPPLTAGVLRININGDHALKVAENRWVDDLSDSTTSTQVFTDTILLIP